MSYTFRPGGRQVAGLSPDLAALIDEAREAGFQLQVDGPLLVLKGPKAAGAIARRLLERKPEVLALLKATYMLPWPEILPNFTRRRVESYTRCTGGPGNVECPHEAGTWGRYGDTATCVACARHAVESAVVVTARPPTPKTVPA